MTDDPQLSSSQKPKSLLETHRDADFLIQALNEYAASHQKPVSRDMMSDLSRLSSSRASLRVSFHKSILPDSSTQDPAQVPNPVASASANPHANDRPKERSSVKWPGLVATSRRKPAYSEQPSVSKLLELGVKVRDFAYESTLPPVPTVYLQPRQIQPSVPKDVNDPNDLHYVLEEERKKKAYSFESTRKIQRTPTEPMLESDLLPPAPRTFPKIKRTDALLDISSQPDSQPQSQPLPSYPALPYDITNTTQFASQPIPGLTIDSQEMQPWINTPIVTPSGSVQWPEKPTATTSTALSTATTQPKAVTSSVNPSMAHQTNSIAASDSQLPSEPETMSYFQMGFARPDPQAPILDGSAAEPSMPKSPSHDHQSSTIQRPSPKRALTPTATSRGAESPDYIPLALTSPLTPSPNSPCASHPASPARSARSPRLSATGSSKSSPHPSPHPSVPALPSLPTSPRYDLRNRNKRRIESSSLLPSRQKTTRSQAVSSPGNTNGKTPHVLSVNSAHLQKKSGPSVVSTGRTLKRPRESNDDTQLNESASALGNETRRKRRNKAS